MVKNWDANFLTELAEPEASEAEEDENMDGEQLLSSVKLLYYFLENRGFIQEATSVLVKILH